MITIDDVILKVLVAIYSHEFLNEKMYLKGGQALRLAHNFKNRLSSDSDFSVSKKIKDKDYFFNEMEEAIRNEFHKDKLFIIDFTFSRRPKIKEQGVPDFGEGWAVDFKLITKKLLSLPPKEQSAKAIIPKGSSSSKISIDISEMEYCESFELIKLKSVEVKVYSKVLLVLEKIRAICQTHHDYALKKI